MYGYQNLILLKQKDYSLRYGWSRLVIIFYFEIIGCSLKDTKNESYLLNIP